MKKLNEKELVDLINSPIKESQKRQKLYVFAGMCILVVVGIFTTFAMVS
jgi:hypothetical protein